MSSTGKHSAYQAVAPADDPPGRDCDDAPPCVLTPAAERALREAAERRAARDAQSRPAAPEHGGRKGPDPVRYGDWEKGGIVSDF